MKLRTAVAVLSANALLVLLAGQAIRGDVSAEGAAPEPVVEASVTVPETGDPVVVEGALSSNTRGWRQAAVSVDGTAAKGLRSELVDAYSLAVAAAPAGCNLTISVLAAIGQVESGNLVGHGLDSEHRVVPAITGPVLDGKRFAAIKDTDDGELDRDKVWDRAVGPMQFIPSSWRVAGVDMDGDGRRDPQDVDDAAGTAMVYLCAGGRDLATADGLREAVLSYNHSASYLRLVLGWKNVFDRNPVTGWSALPLLDAWQLTPAVPSELPTPTAVRARTTVATKKAGQAAQALRPGTASATPGSPVASATPTTPATPTTSSPATPTPADPPTTTPPDTSTPVPSGPADPTKEPEPQPEPQPEPDPLPTCPVPAPVDPAATPTPPTTTPGTEDPPATSTADIPGDGTDEPVECVLPIDPETGLPITPAPQAEASTEPGAGTGD